MFSEYFYSVILAFWINSSRIFLVSAFLVFWGIKFGKCVYRNFNDSELLYSVNLAFGINYFRKKLPHPVQLEEVLAYSFFESREWRQKMKWEWKGIPKVRTLHLKIKIPRPGPINGTFSSFISPLTGSVYLSKMVDPFSLFYTSRLQ